MKFENYELFINQTLEHLMWEVYKLTLKIKIGEAMISVFYAFHAMVSACCTCEIHN